jgi:mRNA-degrading endonuclease toxin of MazEF toxin-antitoxin module
MLLSRNAAYAYLNKFIVAELTSTVRGIPEELPVGSGEGLARECVVNFDNIHVVAKRQLGELAGVLHPRRTRELKRALGHALDWPELKSL